MRILILSQYYWPENISSPIFITQLAEELVRRGHEVTALVAMPNYPKRVVFEEYRGKLSMVEQRNGVRIIRTFIKSAPKNGGIHRIINWGSFILSSRLLGVGKVGPQDVVYSILPPLPLGDVGLAVGRRWKCAVVSCIEDIYPKIAIDLGLLKNQKLISYFLKMEKRIYMESDVLTGISTGFKEHFMETGVPSDKIEVIPNWADGGKFGSQDTSTAFRKEMGLAEDDVVVTYSGGLTFNSSLEPLLEAAAKVKNPKVKFMISGEGPRREDLMKLAEKLGLKNITFLTYVDLERYPEWLATANMTVVTLRTQAKLASVPSKIFKQMAARRPILAITERGNELDRLVTEGECGYVHAPADVDGLAASIDRLASDPALAARLGASGRSYFDTRFDMKACIDQIEAALHKAVQSKKAKALP